MGSLTGKATDIVFLEKNTESTNNESTAWAEHVILVKTTDIICAGLNE
jgi:hypothetical protein